jgi:signal transduction histidine kinase
LPGRDFDASVEESVVEARPDRLARGVNNLLDNAVKFSDDTTGSGLGVATVKQVVEATEARSPRRTRRAAGTPFRLRLGSEECGWWDSNPHGLSPTAS